MAGAARNILSIIASKHAGNLTELSLNNASATLGRDGALEVEYDIGSGNQQALILEALERIVASGRILKSENKIGMVVLSISQTDSQIVDIMAEITPADIDELFDPRYDSEQVIFCSTHSARTAIEDSFRRGDI